MSRRKFSELEVREQLEAAQARSARDGKTLTVAAFAQETGIKRPTLYSSYPDVVAELNAQKASNSTAKQGRPRDERLASLRDNLQIARRQRDEAQEELKFLAQQIRMLTVQNSELLAALEAYEGVEHLSRHRR